MESEPTIEFRYQGFYDYPLCMLMKYRGLTLMLVRDFDESLDDYWDYYELYLMPEIQKADLEGGWDQLQTRSIHHLGNIPISQLIFDSTHRKKMIIKPILEKLIESHVIES